MASLLIGERGIADERDRVERAHELRIHDDVVLGLQTDASEGDLGELADRVPDAAAEVGRNDPCPCGSGRKYKRGCGA